MPTGSLNFREFTCRWCENKFIRYVAPSDPRSHREFCSRRCQAKHMKNSHLPKEERSGVRTLLCDFCKTYFTKHVKASQVPKFCSRRCACKFLAASGRNAASSFSSTCLPPDVVEKIRRARSSSTRSRNLGRRLTKATKSKISKSCSGIENPLKGKTFEQYYGAERAAELSREHSRKLRESFASGRIKITTRTKSAPTFRGTKLRSELEKDAIEFLERRDGLLFSSTLLYEADSTKVQWLDACGISHTYTPDLYDVKNDVIYEVKPKWKVVNPTDVMKRKEKAILDSGRKFRYLTDEDIVASRGEGK